MTDSGDKNHPISSYRRVVDELVCRCSEGVGPILGNNWRTPKWEGVGTGFVLIEEGRAYLVTASHVLDCAFKYKHVVARIFGKLVDLHGLYFASSPEFDVAVTLLPKKWLECHGIFEMYAPSAVQLPSSYEGTGHYIALGFPASMNKMDPRWSNRQTTAAVFHLLPSEPNIVTTTIPQPLCFTYDPKEHRVGGRNPPALQGMSGGPIWEIFRRRMAADSTTGLSLYPKGFMCEWHKRQKSIVAGSIDSVVSTIHGRSIIWKLAGNLHGRAIPRLWHSSGF